MLSIDLRKAEKKQSTTTTIDWMRTLSVLDKCRLTYFLCFTIWWCRFHISKKKIYKMKDWEQATEQRQRLYWTRQKKNQFTRSAIVDAYLTCCHQASQQAFYTCNVCTLVIVVQVKKKPLISLLSRAELCRFCCCLYWIHCSAVARFLIIIYGNNCYFYADGEEKKSNQFLLGMLISVVHSHQMNFVLYCFRCCSSMQTINWCYTF